MGGETSAPIGCTAGVRVWSHSVHSLTNTTFAVAAGRRQKQSSTTETTQRSGAPLRYVKCARNERGAGRNTRPLLPGVQHTPDLSAPTLPCRRTTLCHVAKPMPLPSNRLHKPPCCLLLNKLTWHRAHRPSWFLRPHCHRVTFGNTADLLTQAHHGGVLREGDPSGGPSPTPLRSAKGRRCHACRECSQRTALSHTHTPSHRHRNGVGHRTSQCDEHACPPRNDGLCRGWDGDTCSSESPIELPSKLASGLRSVMIRLGALRLACGPSGLSIPAPATAAAAVA